MPDSIFVSLLTDENDFQLAQAADARATCGRLGLGVQVSFAQNDAYAQIRAIFAALAEAKETGLRAIVCETVSGEGMERPAESAAKAGIGWVVINRSFPYFSTLRESHPSLPIFSISTDHVEVGRIQARQLQALVPSGGQILYIEGPPGTTPTQHRSRGFHEVIGADRYQIKVLAGDWTERSGAAALSTWLLGRASRIVLPAAIVSQNDAMAVGARRGISQHPGLESLEKWLAVPVFGVDGLPEGGQKAVDEGHFAATVVCPLNTGPAIERIERALRTGGRPPAEVLIQPKPYPNP
jgi:ABC-type sugar transport system substrate-binding protein